MRLARANLRPLLPFALLFVFTSPDVAGQPCEALSFDEDRLRFTDTSSRLLVADLNRDGASDLVARGGPSGDLWALWGKRDRDYGRPRRLAAPPVSELHTVLDFQGLGPTDLFVSTPSGPAILVGSGTGGFRELLVTGVDTPVEPQSWRFGDLNSDLHLDVVVVLAGPTTTVDVYLGDGRGAFTAASSVRLEGVSSSHPVLALADLTSDGALDVAVLAFKYPSSDLYVLSGDGAGGFGPPRAITRILGGADAIFTADFDRDGRIDLLTVTSIGGAFGRWSVAGSVYWGDGEGGFTGGALVSGTVGGSFTIADVDGDARPDVVSSCPQYPCYPFGTSVTRALDGRRFASKELLTPLISSMQPADLDGDGRADLVPSAASSTIPDLIVLTNRCDGSPFARSFFVPVVLSARNAAGALLTSELVLTNRGPNDVTVDLTYVASQGSGSGAARLVLPRGRQRIVEDAIVELRLLGVPIPEGAGRLGSLRVRFSGASGSTDASVQARTRSPFEAGEVGVGFAPLRVADGLTETSVVSLLRETVNVRTNLALVSLAVPDEGDVVLRVTVVSTDPGHPGSATLPDVYLGPGQFVQLDRVLARSGLGAGSGWCRIERLEGDVAYAAYAVLNDNVSHDGSVIPASTRPSNLLPVVVETESFTTEVLLTNTSASDRTVTLTLRAPAVDNHMARKTLFLPSGGQVSLPAFASGLCAEDAVAVCAGPVRADPVGYATAEPGSYATADAGVFTTALVTGTGATSRYGVAITNIPQTGGRAVWLDGLRQDPRHRTNVGLVHLEQRVPYRIEIFDGDSGTRVATVDDVTLGSEGWIQFSSFLATYAPGVTNAYARVARTDGSWYPTLAYAVLTDGARPGMGTSDGTYMQAQ